MNIKDTWKIGEIMQLEAKVTVPLAESYIVTGWKQEWASWLLVMFFLSIWVMVSPLHSLWK